MSNVITATTKTVRKYVRNNLATSDVHVTGTWTDNNSTPGHRNVTFRVQSNEPQELVEAYKYVSMGLAFEGIRVGYNQIDDNAAYLRLNRVPFDG